MSQTITKTYVAKEAEAKWYAYWLENKFFKSEPSEKTPYTIVIPPPNVTGVLHMGHMLNNTIQDVLIRRARMQGFEACWVPGTDHASIATEAKVVAMLKEKGIAKKDLSREDFLKYAWELKEKYGGIILEQLKKLGASCDWDRTRFTMEDDMSDAVLDVFVDLHKKGLIYKGTRMVNWDPQGKTALSDEEVIHKEVNSKLYNIKYKIVGSDDFLVVATTRPETLLGDTAVCVNPNDERYQHLKGKQVIVPLVNRAVDVIFDEYVDIEFGTGCLKVTPAHDLNDHELGKKHNLQVIDILNEDGTISPAGQLYIGEDRFVVRKKIAKDLEAADLLVKVEDIKNKVGYSERTDAVVEPRLSAQWFVDMRKFLDKNPQVLESVMSDEIALYPAKFKNTYRHWLDNIKDWCISRQLWWGQRIPAFYAPDKEFVVAKTVEEAITLFKEKGKSYTAQDLSQDEDVLDTWFSSWLWPISVFDGFKDPNNKDSNYYYPTDTLVTAPEILFFWVARMIMAGYEYKGALPFKSVYLTGIVRDKQARKMSKSLGNSPDPLDLIEKYGADGVRVGMLLSSPAGNDLLFDEKQCEQGRNFTNKLWNAYRLVNGWNVDAGLPCPNDTAFDWFENRLNSAIVEIEDHYEKFRLSDALMGVYKLVWDDFCSWYLEMVKPGFEQPIDQKSYDKTIQFLESILKLVHPFVPFLSEELWHEIKDRKVSEALIVAEYPQSGSVNENLLKEAEQIFAVVTEFRNTRNGKGLSPKNALPLKIQTANQSVYSNFASVLTKLCNLSEVTFVNDKVADALSFVIKGDEFFIPIEGGLDKDAEKEAIVKELEYIKGFLKSVEAKLGNERFVANAKPEIIENERNKQADALANIAKLQEKLARLV